MILLEIEDYCQDCEYFIPTTDTLRIESIEGFTRCCDTFIRCENKKKCESMYRRLKREKDRKGGEA